MELAWDMPEYQTKGDDEVLHRLMREAGGELARTRRRRTGGSHRRADLCALPHGRRRVTGGDWRWAGAHTPARAEEDEGGKLAHALPRAEEGDGGSRRRAISCTPAYVEEDDRGREAARRAGSRN